MLATNNTISSFKTIKNFEVTNCNFSRIRGNFGDDK